MVPAWTETCRSSFYIFNVFNNHTFYTSECISWIIQWLKSVGYSEFFHPYCYKDSLLLGCDIMQLCEYSSAFRRLLLSTKRQEMFVPSHIQGKATWRWRHCDASKCRKLVFQYHNVTYQKIWILRHSVVGRFRKNCEKRLLASSCQSVRPHGNRLPLDRF